MKKNKKKEFVDHIIPGLIAAFTLHILEYLIFHEVNYNIFGPFRESGKRFFLIIMHSPYYFEKLLLCLSFALFYFIFLRAIVFVTNKMFYNNFITVIVAVGIILIDGIGFTFTLTPILYSFLMAYVPIFLLFHYFYCLVINVRDLTGDHVL